MSVILNALRSKDSVQTANEKLWPKEGMFIDVEKSDSTKGTRITILIIALFAATVFAVVRLSAMYFSATTASSFVAVPIAAMPVVVQPKSEPVANVEMAKAFFAQHRLDESVKIYEQLIQKEPSNAMLFNDLGFVLMKQRRELEAESRLHEAIAINPECAECYNNLGMLSTQMGRVKDAEKYLMRAIEINEIYPEPHFNLAVLLRKAGDEKSAMLHFEDFLKWTPNRSSPIARQVQALLDASVEEEIMLD